MNYYKNEFFCQSVCGMLDANSPFQYHHKPIVTHFPLYSNFPKFKNSCQIGTKGAISFWLFAWHTLLSNPVWFFRLVYLEVIRIVAQNFTYFSICLIFLFAWLCIKSNVYVQWLSWQVLEVFSFEEIVHSLT